MMLYSFNLKWLTILFVFLLVGGYSTVVKADATPSLKKVNEHVYAVVGPLGNRTPENLGNNATFGFIITDDGVVLIDSGGSYQGAAAIERLIRQVTDQPVKVVINTGGQDHRWLGNGYFKERGAHIIASAAAVNDQKARLQDQLFMLGNLIGSEKLAGTDAVYADEVFDKIRRFDFGGITFELHHAGPAHTPGDSFVWLPEQRIVFAGDIVFTERLLGVLPYSNSRGWITAFEALVKLQPGVVVPGHGEPTSIARARAETYDYLVFLRDRVERFMEAGGDITRVGTLDQSRFQHLPNFDTLSGRNAQQVWQEMEWE